MKIGILSDIHEDINSLKKAVALLEAEHCDRLVCLGDMVGYAVPFQGFFASRNSPEVIKMIQNDFDIVTAGNHDLYAIRKLPRFTNFAYPENWYSLNYWKRKELADEKIWLYEHDELSALLTEENASYIDSLPEYVISDFNGTNVFFSHHAYPDLNGNMRSKIQTPSDAKEHFAFMKTHGCNIAFSGHMHIEGVAVFNRDERKQYGFEEITLNRNEQIWIQIPCVVNGSFSSGVIVFDTDSYSLKAIPIPAEKHVTPAWRHL